MHLLTKSESSPKLARYTGNRFAGAILYLASGTYKRELCPAAGSCLKTCLIDKAGRGGFDPKVRAARRRKTDLYYADRPLFMQLLRKDIDALIRSATKIGQVPVIRLNGGSDLDWSEIYAEYKGRVMFWEYTKRPDLAFKLKAMGVHVTFSYSENTTPRLLQALFERNINVAVVMQVKKGKELPQYFQGMPVIDGDLHDYRFLDRTGCVIGLRLKSTRRPTTEQVSGGFVQGAA